MNNEQLVHESGDRCIQQHAQAAEQQAEGGMHRVESGAVHHRCAYIGGRLVVAVPVAVGEGS
jgi:hypothetical protein